MPVQTAGAAAALAPHPRAGSCVCDHGPALKAGAVLVAKRAQVPLIPIGIVGTNHVWPVGARLPRLARIVHPSSVRLEIGAPLEVGANTKETLDRLRLAITAQIELAERMELDAKRREERQ
jgi:1-acyl-sn-glycerol-3-phosphate acyltransferase